VGDDNDCSIIPVQIVKQREDAIGRFAVDGACRLIGEDQSGFICDCPGNRDALLLATGQLMRPMVKSMRKTDPIQGILRFAPPFAASHASIGQRQLDILERAGSRQQRSHLEHEADFAAAQGSPSIAVQIGHFKSLEYVLPAIGCFQKSKQTHQGRLSGPGAPDDRYKLAGINRK
jgi:hypothetical protein